MNLTGRQTVYKGVAVQGTSSSLSAGVVEAGSEAEFPCPLFLALGHPAVAEHPWA